MGTGEVRSVGYVENGKSTVTYTLDGTKYEFEIANGQVYKTGQAPEVTEPEVTTGNLVKKITAVNYGDKIDYSANGINDWKIFYKDNENVFIITSNCIPNEKIPEIEGMSINNADEYYENGPYWDYTTPLHNVGANGIDIDIAKKFQLNWLFAGEHRNSKNKNMGCVYDLMNTEFWKDFASGIHDAKSIGSPTLEMWINSWNEKFPEQKLRFNGGEEKNSDGTMYENTWSGEKESYDSKTHENGYFVGTITSGSTYDSLGNTVVFSTIYSELLDYDLSLYEGNGLSYWLASPNSQSSVSLYDVEIAQQLPALMERNCVESRGIRPVVCLPSTVNATKIGDTWKIE